jgi:hypothetical protein
MKWLKAVAQFAVILGGIFGVTPQVVPEKDQTVATQIATIAGVAAGIALHSPRKKGQPETD